jgi:transcriptional regulator with XRE-family HTH domain
MGTTSPRTSAAEFSERLKQALAHNNKTLSPTHLEREFNLRYKGNPITPHAARKWLMGTTAPTLDKVQVLARWLNVDESWLRWGYMDTLAIKTPPGVPPHPPTEHLSPVTSLVQDWELLSPRNQRLARTLIETLLKEQQNSDSVPFD